VSLVIANGLRHGTRAALVNIAGVQAGLAIVIGVVAIGLTSIGCALPVRPIWSGSASS
jgi:threonine/homoserine/homoserine lactone efflux protein